MSGIVILLVVAGTVSAIVGVVAKQGKRTRATWQSNAAELGLSFRPGPRSGRPIHARHHLPQMYGHYDGQDVYVGVRSYTTGSGQSRKTHYYTFIDVLFNVPLKRGLGVRPANGVSKFFGSIFGQNDIQIGDPSFDKKFRIDGLDQRQVTSLLGHDTLRRALDTTYPFGFLPSLNDDRVRLEAKGVIVQANKLKPQIQGAVALYREVVAAWDQQPPSNEELQITPGWQQVAERKQLSFEPRAMLMVGRLNESSIRCEVVLNKNQFSTEMEARFEPPLGGGLSIKKQGALSSVKKIFGAQDIIVGDEVFDRRYLIKGKDVERVKAILIPEARVGLSQLDDLSHQLLVTDDILRLTFNQVYGDGPAIERVLEMITLTTKAMTQFARPTTHGPFR